MSKRKMSRRVLAKSIVIAVGLSPMGALSHALADDFPSTTNASTSRVELETQRTAILKQIQDDFAHLKQTDPLYVEVEKRNDSVATRANALNTREIQNWLDNYLAKNPQDETKYDKLFSIHTLLQATKMLKDPVDRSLLHDFVLGKPQLPQAKNERGNRSVVQRSELSVLRNALSQQLPNLDRKALDDPIQFWKVLSDNGPLIEKNVEDAAKQADAACIAWPKAVLKHCIAQAETYLPNRVYTYYIEEHEPASIPELANKIATINKALDNH